MHTTHGRRFLFDYTDIYVNIPKILIIKSMLPVIKPDYYDL